MVCSGKYRGFFQKKIFMEDKNIWKENYGEVILNGRTND